MRLRWSIIRKRLAEIAQEWQQHASKHKHNSGALLSPMFPAVKQNKSRYPWQHYTRASQYMKAKMGLT